MAVSGQCSPGSLLDRRKENFSVHRGLESRVHACGPRPCDVDTEQIFCVHQLSEQCVVHHCASAWSSGVPSRGLSILKHISCHVYTSFVLHLNYLLTWLKLKKMLYLHLPQASPFSKSFLTI